MHENDDRQDHRDGARQESDVNDRRYREEVISARNQMHGVDRGRASQDGARLSLHSTGVSSKPWVPPGALEGQPGAHCCQQCTPTRWVMKKKGASPLCLRCAIQCTGRASGCQQRGKSHHNPGPGARGYLDLLLEKVRPVSPLSETHSPHAHTRTTSKGSQLLAWTLTTDMHLQNRTSPSGHPARRKPAAMA